MAGNTSLEPSTSFGGYLRFLRRRARMTQTDLSVAVGYSPGQISMLENGRRIPDVTAVMALFIAALGLHEDPRAAALLVELARTAGSNAAAGTGPAGVAPGGMVTGQIAWQQEDLGLLEDAPPLPTYFVERRGPGAQVTAWLKRDHRAAICGLPGMGKSTLAAALAHAEASRYPVFWHTFSPSLTQTTADVLRQLAIFALAYGAPSRQTPLLRRVALGEVPGPLRQLMFAVAAGLNTLRAPLLVFDDAHLVSQSTPPAGAQAGVQPGVQSEDVLAAIQSVGALASNVRLLYVTREELYLPGVPHFMLGGMAHDEAVRLVTALGESSPRGQAIDADPIFQQTAGNPLLLRLVVSQLEQQIGLASATAGAALAAQLVASLVAQLPESARLLLDGLAVWRGVADLTDPNLAIWLGSKLPTYDHDLAVRALRRKRLFDHDVHAILHPLLREPLLARLAADPAHHRAVHALAAAWAEQRGDLIEAAHHFVAADDLARACDLLGRPDAPLIAPAQVNLATSVIDEILARLPHHAQRTGTTATQAATQARLLGLRGDLLIHTLRAAEARANYRAAMELTDDSRARAHLAQRLAVSLLQIGRAQDARHLCEDALHMLAADESPVAFELQLQLGGVLVRALLAVGELDAAAALCHQAIETARPLRLVKPAIAEKLCAGAYQGLGYIARRLGDQHAARADFARAAAHARAGNWHSDEAEALAYMSACLRDLGDFAEAEAAGVQALTVAQGVGNDHLAAGILHHLSVTSYYHADLAIALARSQQAATLYQQIGDPEGVVSCDTLQGVVYAALGRLDLAITAIDRARRDSLWFDNHWLQGMALYVYGIVHTFAVNLHAAEGALRQALTVEDLVKDPPMRESVLLFIGINAVAQGNFEAVRWVEAQLVGNVSIEAELLTGHFRGMAAIAVGDLAQAHAIGVANRTRALQSGYLVYAAEAAQLIKAAGNPPPLAQLPAYVCLHVHADVSPVADRPRDPSDSIAADPA